MANHTDIVDLTSSPEPDVIPKASPTPSRGHASNLQAKERVSLPELLNGKRVDAGHIQQAFRAVSRSAVDVQTNGSSRGTTPSLGRADQAGLLRFGQRESDKHVHKRRSSASFEDAHGRRLAQHTRTKQAQDSRPSPSPTARPSLSQAQDGHSVVRGTPYSEQENTLLLRLKVAENRSWDEIERHFPGRSRASLQVHFSTKLRTRSSQQGGQIVESKQDDRPRRDQRRNGGRSVLDGFVSWKDVKAGVLEQAVAEVAVVRKSEPSPKPASTSLHEDIAPRKTLARHLRQRELGGDRSGLARIPEELVNHTSVKFRLHKTFSPTCGDVNSVVWSPDIRKHGVPLRFAVASIAVSDHRNMQYNGALNLLVGDRERSILQELPDHHVERPVIPPDLSNPNSLDDMRNTQDSRLYRTVNAVAFSSCGTRLFSAGDDGAVRSYRFKSRQAVLEHTLRYSAPVALMSVNSDDLVATTCKGSSSTGTYVEVQNLKEDSVHKVFEKSINHCELAPAALRWGTSPWHKQYLLAGFSGEGDERDAPIAGATYLWDVYGSCGERIGQTPNVFQVAWNPTPSSASTWFCVASAPAKTPSKNIRSVVQCFGPGKTFAIQELVTWDCPAKDINELTYCQHDPMLIAAGGTDGRVYVWDKRFANRNQQPLQIFEHGYSVQVLDHDRDFEEADTGIGFLSWGATSSRLYSGSSDGVVKVWDPYRAPEDAFRGDVARFSTAVMSGSFSPDYRDLLIGEDSGRLNLLSLDHQATVKRARMSLKLERVPMSSEPGHSHEEAKELLSTGQIELRPMGNMPVRQAVQGKNYKGPFFRPSEKAWKDAQTAFDDAQVRIASADSPGAKVETAKKQLQAAENLLLDYRARETDWQQLETNAVAKQRSWAIQEARPDPAIYDRAGAASSALRDANTAESNSRQRIPQNLRRLPIAPLDVASLTCQELYDLSLAPPCEYCELAERATSRRLRVYYQSVCKTQRVRTNGRLSKTCRTCGAPMQSEASSDAGDFCVKCSFACIRCGRDAELSASTSRMICNGCNLSRTVDVLGYNIDECTGTKGPYKRSDIGLDDADDEEVIDAHLDHLWTFWGSESYPPRTEML